ncbi:MAG: hypothetical protein OXC30_00495 [Alphaproteobacteria bacterium]|nr:hypothetical protein [Alphaproteobacteria bacterium]
MALLLLLICVQIYGADRPTHLALRAPERAPEYEDCSAKIKATGCLMDRSGTSVACSVPESYSVERKALSIAVAKKSKNHQMYALVFSEAFEQIAELADLFAIGLIAAEEAIGTEKISPLDQCSSVALIKKAFNKRVDQACRKRGVQSYRRFDARVEYIKSEVKSKYIPESLEEESKFYQLITELDELTGYVPAPERRNRKLFDRAFKPNRSLEEESDPKNSFDKLAAQIKALVAHTYIQEKSSHIYEKVEKNDAKIAQQLARQVQTLDKLTKWAAQPSSVVNQVTVLNDARETAKQVKALADALARHLASFRGYFYVHVT